MLDMIVDRIDLIDRYHVDTIRVRIVNMHTTELTQVADRCIEYVGQPLLAGRTAQDRVLRATIGCAVCGRYARQMDRQGNV